MFTMKKVVFAIVVAAISVMLMVGALNSQSASQRESQLSQEQIQMVMPMLRQMMETMMDGMLTTVAKKESAEKLAKFKRNLYDALLAQGFTKEETMQIVVATGIPSMPSMK